MILFSWHRVNGGPTVLTEILQTVDTSAIERSRFLVTLHTMTFVTHLTFQDIRFDLNLNKNTHLISLERPSQELLIL